MNQIFEVLKKIFGFSSFRPNQKEIIESILQKKDVFAVMPTGGGKSLCYQLPAQILPGTAVVISPLISLMKDQVDGARENGISAAYLNSSQSPMEMQEVLSDLKAGKWKILYISPERFALPHFLKILQSLSLSFFAIDEAHCISEWGHDFRPDYLGLSQIPRLFPSVPIAAFTATATFQVQEDIISKMGLRHPFLVRASFNRDNLFYEVQKKDKVHSQVMDFLQEHSGEAGIIYRTTRESVVEFSNLLNQNGFRSLPYHAGLGNEERQKNQEAFNKDRVDIMVATIAFGMGIDKSNVRFVIHMDLPKSLEGYYQETGRAGRDGDPAHCLFFFSRSDVHKIIYFIDQMIDEKERQIASQKMNQVVRFATHNQCRRKQLLEYFGEVYPKEKCLTCDICLQKVETVDASRDAQIFLSAMVRTQQQYGIKHNIDIVMGSKGKKIIELGHDQLKTFGVGAEKDRRYWQCLVDELLAQELMRQDGNPYPVLKINPSGYEVLYGKKSFWILKPEEKKKKSKSTATATATAEAGQQDYDRVLFKNLRQLRKKLAEDQGVAPFLVFSDKTLREMCQQYPATEEEFRQISGVGEVKLQRYGKDFLFEVRQYLAAHPEIVPSVAFPPKEHKKENKKEKEIPSSKKITKKEKYIPSSESLQTTLNLFEKGLDLEGIAAERNLKPATISEHLAELLETGKIQDLSRLVSPQKANIIAQLFVALQSWELKPVVENLGVTYIEAKLVRAYMKWKNRQIQF